MRSRRFTLAGAQVFINISRMMAGLADRAPQEQHLAMARVARGGEPAMAVTRYQRWNYGIVVDP